MLEAAHWFSRKIILFLLCCSSLTGCSTAAQQFDAIANNLNLTRQTIEGGLFLHRVYNKQTVRPENRKKILHVYIDGDGTPWEKGRWPAFDPTSRTPLILKLIQTDPNPAILLGRPCYHGLNESAPCRPEYWTSHRYAYSIVDSMTAALKNWLTQHRYQKIRLIGFSGGGTLAVLMADKLQNIEAVVTLAANLDTAAWSRQHGYQLLKDSLNPIEQPPLPPQIRQVHFAGLQDKNVPAEIIERFSNRQSNALYFPVPNYEHRCCWDKNWTHLLKRARLN